MQQDLEKKSVAELTRQVEDLTRQVTSLTQHTRSLEERAFDLYTICQVGRAFTGDNPVKISEVLVAAMSDRIGANRALVLLARQPRGPFKPIYAHGLPNEVVQKISFQPRQGILWQLLKAGEPFAVADSSGQTLFPREFEESNLNQAGICYWVPLLAKDEVLGVVCLDKSCDSEAEARFFYLLASQGATALDNARLYQELQTSKRDLGYQMNKLAMLYDVGRALNVIDDRNRLLTEILGRAAAIAEAEKGSIMLFDEGSDELVVQVVRGIDPETEQKILNGEIVTKRLKRGEGVAGQVAATGTPMVVNNVFDGPQFVRSLTSRVNSILCVPLRVHGDVIGVLNITNKFQGKTFSDADLQIIQQVADQAAVAIHNARLYEMAVTDSLTHLYIRRHLFHRLNEEMRRAHRYKHPVSLLMVDIDHFKSLNDTHGHPCGDKVLVEVARILRRSVRETDLVGRYGGEEFCLVMPETDIEGAFVVANRMHSLLEALDLVWEGTPLRVAVSGGVATFPDQATTLEELVRSADAALYFSKRNGRNQTSPFQPEHLLHLKESPKLNVDELNGEIMESDLRPRSRPLPEPEQQMTSRQTVGPAAQDPPEAPTDKKACPRR